jgi:hypothetical protein
MKNAAPRPGHDTGYVAGTGIFLYDAHHHKTGARP